MSGRSTALRPGTASRLKAGASRGDGRPSSLTIGAAVQFEDRPITQQGLGGMKVGGRGTKRQVEDKSFYLGLLRTRIAELDAETTKLRASHEELQRDSGSFAQYEAMAESLAKDIQDLQGQLADANTLLDRLNTEQDSAEVQLECDELRDRNEAQEAALEATFEERKRAEADVATAERELDQERRMADSIVARMRPEQQRQHRQLREEAERTSRELEASQRELDNLRRQRARLEDELSGNLIKQEAVRLCEQLRELADRRDALLEDERAAGDPNQERERLLNQVREDNAEIGTMERQSQEAQARLSEVQAEIRATEEEIEATSGQRSQQYRELRKREEQMDSFLGDFERSAAAEKAVLAERERQVVDLLDGLSRSVAMVTTVGAAGLPTEAELKAMREQLSFKAGERDRADATVLALAESHEKLVRDAAKIDQLERKTADEIETQRAKIDTMRQELEKFENVAKMMEEGEEKREELGRQRHALSSRRDRMKRLIRSLERECDARRRELSDNETHAQLANLERRWQHQEQNNFVIRDFVASKMAESDTSLVSGKALSLAQNLNARLAELAAKQHRLA
ncbi:hypothetical protein BOX15_Mlig003260g1 [Macrostomum lignano]|uniref:Uncharacterized protein n=1 Tax=Macrostomum lignano TaxID=282301 RepID=A0A267DK44_9PLAT|nr:hypothetical protein BOX15_Mlig003260g1 [Macrostomum lignano]